MPASSHRTPPSVDALTPGPAPAPLALPVPPATVPAGVLREFTRLAASLVVPPAPPAPGLLTPAELQFLDDYSTLGLLVPHLQAEGLPEAVQAAVTDYVARSLVAIQAVTRPLFGRLLAEVAQRPRGEGTRDQVHARIWQVERTVRATLEAAAPVGLAAVTAAAPDSPLLASLITQRLDGTPPEARPASARRARPTAARRDYRQERWETFARGRLLCAWLLRLARLPGADAAALARRLVAQAQADPAWLPRTDAGEVSVHSFGSYEQEVALDPSDRQRLLDAITSVPGSLLLPLALREALQGTDALTDDAPPLPPQLRAAVNRQASAVVLTTSRSALHTWVRVLHESELRQIAFDDPARLHLVALAAAPVGHAGRTLRSQQEAEHDALAPLHLLAHTPSLMPGEAEALLDHPVLGRVSAVARERLLLPLLAHPAMPGAARRRVLRQLATNPRAMHPESLARLVVQHEPDLLADPVFAGVVQAVRWRQTLEDALSRPDTPVAHRRLLVPAVIERLGPKVLADYLAQYPAAAARVPWGAVLAHPQVLRHPLRAVLMSHAVRVLSPTSDPASDPADSPPKPSSPDDPGAAEAVRPTAQVSLRHTALAGVRGRAERLRSSAPARLLLAELVRDGGAGLALLPRALVARLVRVAALGAVHWTPAQWAALAPLGRACLAGESEPCLALHLARRHLVPALSAMRLSAPAVDAYGHARAAGTDAETLQALMPWLTPPLLSSPEVAQLLPTFPPGQRRALLQELRHQAYATTLPVLSDDELDAQVRQDPDHPAASRAARAGRAAGDPRPGMMSR